ncbi:hypothetical protein ABPG72_022433 [Tetrahymena utriculariae]
MNILNNKLKLACAIGAGIAGIEQNYGLCDFIYFNRIGSYNTIGADWIKLQRDAHKYFTNAQFIGIYFDNPKLLDDPNQARAALGFAAGNREKDKIKVFLDSKLNYQFAQLPEVKSYSTNLSYKSSFSFRIIKDKVYPKITGYALEKNLSSFCLVETYQFQDQNKEINFDIPFGENSESYYLF